MSAVLAERCVVSTCAYLSLNRSMPSADLAMQVSILKDLLPQCEDVSAELTPLVVAVEALCSAPADQRHKHLTRLSMETGWVFQLIAAKRFQAWTEAQEAVRHG